MWNSGDFFEFFDITPDLVCIAGKDGYFRKVNKSVCNTLGYSEEELKSRLISSFIHPDDRESTAKTRAEMLNGKTLLNFENRYVTKNGAVIWLSWTSIYHAEKELIFAIAKNITGRKKIEKEIESEYQKFKSLAIHFRSSMEEDRKFLAAELHEEMAQLASVIKMDIDWVNRREHALSPASRNRLEHAAGITELLIATIRRITFSIGSSMLNHIGLQATLEWQCREFAMLTGVSCSFQSDIQETCGGESELDLLRISQEALTSYMLNTEIKEVAISLEKEGGRLVLHILLNYKTLINRQLFANSLDRIRDRVIFMNAELQLQDDGDHQTQIRVKLTA